MARLIAIEAITLRVQQRGGRLYSDELRPMYLANPSLKETIGNLKQFIATVPELVFHARTDDDRPYVTIAKKDAPCGKGEKQLFARYRRGMAVEHARKEMPEVVAHDTQVVRQVLICIYSNVSRETKAEHVRN